MSQRGKAPGVRERVRAQMTAEILSSARDQLSTGGADSLSLRAIARDLDMSSSAIYRYFSSRDALLTQLIIDAFESVGATAEAADAAVPREDLNGRFLATCGAVRDWAIVHPREYALIFGSPVPGYAAPQDTIAPATRIPVVLISVLLEAAATNRIAARPDLPAGVAESMQPLLLSIAEIVSQQELSGNATVGDSSDPTVPGSTQAGDSFEQPAPGSELELPESLIARGLIAWTHLIGAISFELFGHRHNVIGDSTDAKQVFFEYETSVMIDLVGLS